MESQHVAAPSPEVPYPAAPAARLPAGRYPRWRLQMLALVLLAVLLASGALPGSGTPSAAPAGPTAGPARTAATAGPALAAVVDGIPVTMAAYRRQLRFVANAYGGPRAPAGTPAGRTIRRLMEDRAIQQAIAEALIDRQAGQHRLVAGRAQVDAEVARITADAGGAAALRRLLRRMGMTRGDLRRMARYVVLRAALAAALHDPAWLDHLAARSRIVYYAGDGAAGVDRVPAVSLGHPAPPFVAVDLKGRTVSLADLRGRPVVLSFWATWCAYCRRDLPLLRRFAGAHPGVVVVAVDRQEGAARVRAYLHDQRLQGLSAWLDRDGSAAQAYTLTGLPATFFIDRTGILRAYNFGTLAGLAALNAGARHAALGTDATL